MCTFYTCGTPLCLSCDRLLVRLRLLSSSARCAAAMQFSVITIGARVGEQCKSSRNLCGQFDRVRDELQVLLCFHDGCMPVRIHCRREETTWYYSSSNAHSTTFPRVSGEIFSSTMSNKHRQRSSETSFLIKFLIPTPHPVSGQSAIVFYGTSSLHVNRSRNQKKDGSHYNSCVS